MMKKALLLLSIPSFMLLLASCGPNVRGHGEVKTDSRNLQTFSRISISAPLHSNIHIKEGIAPGIALHGYANIISIIRTDIRDNTLFISIDKSQKIETDKEVEADITLPMLEELSIAGAGDADISGKLTGKAFTLDVSGASDVSAEDISVSDFEAHISGAGDLTVSGGAAERASYTVTGTGNINAFPLQAKEATAAVSGAGNIELTASGKLDASISGVGNVSYKGHPVISSHKSGVGSLDDAN